ncbi:serine/threonine-protein kinase [Sphingomonas colocasiae]|uniref:Serine/threonine protein kinase n=1 Tax=Sphingomonas colocasiae TaxID=1848973 RepID=A0ABS7PR40_9SPHN|nr:serine/threonine-protein kinase [Sphingomonas colocasiae]MBY8823807.1 serine/threonine protein kinase [Sphingomonas colocasiae]
MPTLEARRRALLLFEQLLDLPPGAPQRATLFADASPEILAEVAALEAAEARSAESFATAFDADAPVFPGERPERVGAYRLDALIGEGGMGEVWRGIRDDGLFEHRVAVKLIRPGIVSAGAEARFVEERRLLARLDHPGVARIIDGGVSEGGWPYLITELVEGDAIDRHCAAQDCDLRTRIMLVRDAARAVEAAHGQLIVHADIKPGNLLVTPRNMVKLLDFGIARLIGGAGDAGPALQPMTRAYASPERAAGALADVADDIYALGLVLRDLVADRPADPGATAIVMRATAPAAANRYRTMEAMGADLDRWLADLPVRAHPRSFRYRLNRFTHRHRFGVAASAIALLAMLGGTTFGAIGHVRAERARTAEAQRIADLRAVSHYLLFDLQAEMARQPNSLRLRTRIAERLQLYLDRMAADPRATPATRIEAAEGLIRLADQQGDPGQANLGQPAHARRNLERAANLAQGLPGPDAALVRARIAIALARQITIYDHALVRADALMTAASRDIDASGAVGVGLRATYQTELATLRAWQNRYDEAIAAARAAMRESLPADPREAALLSSRMADILGESIFYRGDHPGAVAPYRRQLAILTDARARWPDDARIRRNFARATWALGTTLIDIDRAAEALPMLEQGLAEIRALIAQDRDNADAQRMLRIQEIAYTQALGRTGRADEAVAMLAANVETRRRSWLAQPGEAMRLRDYAIAIAALGDLQAEHGRTAEACRTYDQADIMFGRLKRDGKFIEIDRDYSQRLLNEARARYCRNRA